MAKEDYFKNKPKVKGHICSGCIELFPAKELFIVTMPAGYSTPFCDPCIKKDEIAQERISGNMHELQKAEHEKNNPWRKKE